MDWTVLGAELITPEKTDEYTWKKRHDYLIPNLNKWTMKKGFGVCGLVVVVWWNAWGVGLNLVCRLFGFICRIFSNLISTF